MGWRFLQDSGWKVRNIEIEIPCLSRAYELRGLVIKGIGVNTQIYSGPKRHALCSAEKPTIANWAIGYLVRYVHGIPLARRTELEHWRRHRLAPHRDPKKKRDPPLPPLPPAKHPETPKAPPPPRR